MRKFRFPVVLLALLSVFVSAGCVGVVAVHERPHRHPVVIVEEERPVVVVRPRPVVVVRPHHRPHHRRH
jgi:hypothetical protein